MKEAYDQGSVLVVDDHARARESMADVLRLAGRHVDSCVSAIDAMNRLRDESYDVIITDLRMPGMSGLEFIRALNERGCDTQVVMVTAHASVSSAVEAMRYGAFDYIEKPFKVDQLEQLVSRAMRQAATEGRKSSVPAEQADDFAMVGSSAAMQSLRRQIRQAAPTDETVLISGESGTGKELVARSIHAQSGRCDGPLVSMNCPALSPQLMESELFGHERGAFTSADAPRVGRFELADSGTIFLDEITEIELPLQAKLLRVLQERAFERVGASETHAVNVRVIATTNRELNEEVRCGNFRQDLYFRLAVLPIHVPPLRERREDIPELIEFFMQRAAERLVKPPCQLAANAFHLLCEYHWPGNVRELENIITRISVLQDSEPFTADQLRCWLIDAEGSLSPSTPIVSDSQTSPVGMNLHEMERKLIEATLHKFDGHRAKTAEALGIGVRTLANKLRSYGYAPRAKTASAA